MMKKNLLLLVLFCAGCSVKQSPPRIAAAGDSIPHADSTKPSREDFSRLTYEQRQGKFLYAKYCSVCHGEDGKGSGFNAYNCDPKPRDFTDVQIMSALTDERIVRTITGGGRSVNKSPLMPSWGGRMSREEISNVASYLRTFTLSQ
jgi:mono/diheme cytochrome c family protein